MSHAIESEVLHQKHIETVARKHERIEGLTAILNTWLMTDSPYQDMDYCRELKARINGAKSNLKNMRPVKE